MVTVVFFSFSKTLYIYRCLLLYTFFNDFYIYSIQIKFDFSLYTYISYTSTYRFYTRSNYYTFKTLQNTNIGVIISSKRKINQLIVTKKKSFP